MAVFGKFFEFMMIEFTLFGFSFSLWSLMLFEILGTFCFWLLLKVIK